MLLRLGYWLSPDTLFNPSEILQMQDDEPLQLESGAPILLE